MVRADFKFLRRHYWPAIVYQLPFALSPYFALPVAAVPIWDNIMSLACRQRLLIMPEPKPLPHEDRVVAAAAAMPLSLRGLLHGPPARLPWQMVLAHTCSLVPSTQPPNLLPHLLPLQVNFVLPLWMSGVDSALLKDAKVYGKLELRSANRRARGESHSAQTVVTHITNHLTLCDSSNHRRHYAAHDGHV